MQMSIQCKPDQADTLCNLGYCLNLMGSYKDAIEACTESLRLDQSNPSAWTNLGNAQRSIGQPDDALTSFKQALVLAPDDPRQHYNLANALLDLSNLEEAEVCFKRCLSIDDSIPEAHNNLSACLVRLGSFQLALVHASRAIDLSPAYPEAWNNKGLALSEIGHHQEALTCYTKAIEISPEYAEAWGNRSSALDYLGLYQESLDCSVRALAMNPEIDFLLGQVISGKLRICDWKGLGNLRSRLKSDIKVGKRACVPLTALGLIDDPYLLRTCAESYTKAKLPFDLVQPTPRVFQSAPSKKKVRLAYFSMDFRDHPVAHLIAGVIEHHCRDQFEVIGISYGVNTRDGMRTRLETAFDRFLDVRELSGKEIAALSRDLCVDIAIDLAGYTQDSRPEIFASRAAPIQINYLGFPGTMGAKFMDYIIVDPIVVPRQEYEAYSEKLLCLPNSYQANDNKREAAGRCPTRGELGLPESSFVFCCFNNNWKILPEIFDCWMRILKSVEGSVLWLLESNSTASSNLQREAQARGINPRRLVFAKRVEHSHHLARHRVADLFLDTSPYNAHTSASDSLWMGLPVLTLEGRSFAGRVAQSLLISLGINNLVAKNIREYESMAIELAMQPGKLTEIKRVISQNVTRAPLFKTSHFAKNIEQAYLQAIDMQRKRPPPM